MRSRRQLTTWHLLRSVHIATLAASLLSVSGAFLAYDIYTIHDRSLRRLTAEAEMIGHNVAAALAANDRDAAAAALKGMRGDSQILAAGIFGADGVIFAGYGLYDPTDAAALVNSSEGDGHRFINDRLVVYRSITIDKKTVGSVRLLWAMDDVKSSVLRHLAAAAAAFVIALGASLPIFARLQRRPVESGGALPSAAPVVSEPVQAPSPPATEIPTRAAIAVPPPARHTPSAPVAAEFRVAVPPVSSAAAAEPTAASSALLMENLLEVVESLRTTAQLKRVHLQLIVDPGATAVAIAAERLTEILQVLIANAIAATPETGRVKVFARRARSRAEISVSGGGGREARSLLSEDEGIAGRFGREVAIARRLAEHYAGHVRMEQPDERNGVIVIVDLPLCERP